MNIVEAVIAGLKLGADFTLHKHETPQLLFEFPATDVPTVYSYYSRDKRPEKRTCSPTVPWWGVLCFLTTEQFETGSGFGVGRNNGTTVTWRSSNKSGLSGNGRKAAAWEVLYYRCRPNGQAVLRSYLGRLMMHVVINEVADRIWELASYEGIELTRSMKKDLEELRLRYKDPRPRLIKGLHEWNVERARSKRLAQLDKKRKEEASIRL